MNTGEKIKSARKHAGLTQKELGDKLGISQSAIGQFESANSNPNLKTIRKIAEALNIALSEIVDDWGRFSLDEIKKDWDCNQCSPDELGELTSKGRKDTINTLLDLMNDTGQDKAVEQVELLTKIPEYQKEPEK